MTYFSSFFRLFSFISFLITFRLGDKEPLDKEQLGVKELFTDYQPSHIINLLLDKELFANIGDPKTW